MLILLGLVLIVVVVAVAVAVLQTGGDPVQVHAIWWSVHTDGAALFVAGAVSLLVLVLGLWALRVGLRRARRRHQEMKELRRRAFEATPTKAAKSDLPAGATAVSPSPGTVPRRRPPDDDDHFETAPRD